MSGVVDRDLAYESQDARPLIEMWTLRQATFVAYALIVIASLSLFAAVKVNLRTIRVFAVTQKGDSFEIPFYADVAEGRAAAGVIDANAGPPVPKLMSRARPDF